MSERWKSVPLRDLCDFHNGLWIGKKPPFETANVIRNTNFTADGLIDLSDVAVLEVAAKQLAKRRLRNGDIIIEKSGGGPKQPVGRVVLFDLDAENYSFSNFTSVIRIKHAQALNPKYLHKLLYWWYLSGVTESLQRRSTGIRNLDFNAYKDLEVPLPPLDEQKRIVVVLDQAFAALDRARANAEENLADVQALFEIELRLQFEIAKTENNVRSFDTTCQLLTPHVKVKRQNYLEEGKYPIVSQEADLISGFWNESSALMNINGPIVVFGDHTCCLKYIDFDFVVGADGIKVIQPIGGISAKYLYYGLRSYPVRQTGYARHFKFLREAILPDVPLSEQNRVATYLESLETRCGELRSSYKTQLADLSTLRKSMLQAAFSGQLS